MNARAVVIAMLACTAIHCQAQSPAPDDPTLLHATASEPRAYGYQVGDVVSRIVTIHVPDGLKLDEASVPQPGARGGAIELRSVSKSSTREPGGRRHELRFDYQVFLSPPQVRTIEMPTVNLHFEGTPRAQDLHVEAWPLTIAPLVPPEVSPRRGLGELQPDAPPPLIDTSAGTTRLIACGIAALLLLTYLAYVYIGVPWWSRGHRPFTLAWRALRRLAPDSPQAQWREAFVRLHSALNRTAGEAVFEQGVDRFVSAQPRFKPLRDDLVTFFQQSRSEFFAQGGQAQSQRLWLIDFCRRCRDAERGSA